MAGGLHRARLGRTPVKQFIPRRKHFMLINVQDGGCGVGGLAHLQMQRRCQASSRRMARASPSAIDHASSIGHVLPPIWMAS